MARKAAPRNPVRAAGVGDTIRILHKVYPDAHCWLTHESPLQLLVATILSAQCTDTRVNLVTPELFRRFPGVDALAQAPAGALEDAIRTTGFFNAKARSLRGAAKRIVEIHGGEVPRTMAELRALPGVGRKTANVVLGNAFGAPDGVVVDTHVGRLSRRLGWSRHSDPEKVESDLNALVPRREWVYLSHALITHGRLVCTARKPACERCPLEAVCPKRGVATKGSPKTPAANAKGSRARRRAA